jgi:uncharacterized membrane protein YcaP (DUF421 family)
LFWETALAADDLAAHLRQEEIFFVDIVLFTINQIDGNHSAALQIAKESSRHRTDCRGRPENPEINKSIITRFRNP